MNQISTKRLYDKLHGKLSYPAPQTVHVNKQTTAAQDGSPSKPFSTVAAALAHAATLTPSATNRITILIHPGTYTETGLASLQYVDLVGVDRTACILTSPDANHVFTIDTADVSVRDMTFEAQSTGYPFRVLASGVVFVTDCTFSCQGSNFVDVLNVAEFHGCRFESPAGTTNVVKPSSTAAVKLFNCYAHGGLECSDSSTLEVYDTTVVDEVEAINTSTLTLKNCTITETVFMNSSGVLTLDGCFINSPQSYAVYVGVTSTATIINNYLNSVAYSVYVASSVVVTASYFGNSHSAVGVYCVSGTAAFQIQSVRILDVRARRNCFANMRSALQSVYLDTTTIRLFADDSEFSKFYMPTGVKIIFDLMGHFMTGSSGAEMSAGSDDIQIKNGTANFNIDIYEGDFTLDNVTFLRRVVQYGTDKITARDCRLTPSTSGYEAIEVRAAGEIECIQSLIEGGGSTGFALGWFVTNSLVSFKDCQIRHGNGTGNPFTGTTNTYKAEHCELTSAPVGWTNSIPDAVNGNVYLDAMTTSILEHVDTPSTYTGQAKKPLLVNSGETALLFGGVFSKILWVGTANAATRYGTFEAPFNTLTEAVSAANALVPSDSNRILIRLLPGTHTPPTSSLDAYVFIDGVNRDTCIINRGIGSFILGSRPTGISNVTIKTTANSRYHLFIADLDGAGDIYLKNVKFLQGGYTGTLGLRLDGSSGNESTIYLMDCEFDFASPGVECVSCVAGNVYSTIYMYHCKIGGSINKLGGGLYMKDCVSAGTYTEEDGGSAGAFEAHDCTFTGGISPDCDEVKIRNCDGSFSVVVGNAGVTALTVYSFENNRINTVTFDTNVTDVAFYNNIIGKIHVNDGYDVVCETEGFQNNIIDRTLGIALSWDGIVTVGAASTFRTGGRIIHVGGAYNSLRSLDAASGNPAVKQWIVSKPQVSRIASNTITGSRIIRGDPGGDYNRTGRVQVQLDGTPAISLLGTSLTLMNLYLTKSTAGGIVIQIEDGGQCDLTIINCFIDGTIVLLNSTSEVNINIVDSEIWGGSGQYPINIQATRAAFSEIVIRNSFLQGDNGLGAAGHAIYWQAAHDSVQLEWSKAFCGTLNGNPFGKTLGTPVYASHHCVYGLDPETGAAFVNAIGSAVRYDTIDVAGWYFAPR